MLLKPNEIWCYSSNKTALISEVIAAKMFAWLKETSTGYELAGDRTPIIEKNGEMIAALAVRDASALAGFQNIKPLGKFDGEVFIEFFPGAKAIFDRVYSPSQNERSITINGKTFTHKPPTKPGGIFIENVKPDNSIFDFSSL